MSSTWVVSSSSDFAGMSWASGCGRACRRIDLRFCVGLSWSTHGTGDASYDSELDSSVLTSVSAYRRRYCCVARDTLVLPN